MLEPGTVIRTDASKPGTVDSHRGDPGLSRIIGVPGYGAMLWLRWKTLSGSYRRLTSRSRS